MIAVPRFYERKDGWFIVWRETLREQAAKNALTLFLMALGFAITWVVIIVANAWTRTHG